MEPVSVPTQAFPGLAAATLPEAFAATVAAHPERIALRTKGDGVKVTFGEVADRVRRLAAGLAELGVKRGDTFGLMLTNRPEFHILDTAALHLGATCFSIYNTSAPEQIAYLLSDAQNRVVVTEPAFLPNVRAAMEKGGSVEHVVLVEGEGEGALTLADLEAAGDPGFDLAAAGGAVTPDDTLCLIYTSGTTGPPKGVQLTHRNVMAELRAVEEVYGFPRDASTVSFLPAAHIADRLLSHYALVVLGTEVTCCPDPRALMEHVADRHPSVFGGVPRVWEKLKAALEAQFAGNPQLGEAVRAGDEATVGALKAKLGLDRAERFMVGAAPMPREVFEFFSGLGIDICEVWGMSETTAIATLVPPGRVRFGTVGPPIPGVEVKLADDGEVMVRGDIVMTGYRNMPEKTRETLTDDGWLLTGDIGEWDEAGYLKIVDRKKELIINAAGKNMSPANIESQLKSGSPLIGQAIAIGDSRPYNVALIVLDPDVAAAWAAKLGTDPGDLAVLSEHPEVRTEVDAGIARANERLSRVEQIKRYALLPAEWLPGGDELTPTMKLKRKPIAAKYAEEIEGLYG